MESLQEDTEHPIVVWYLSQRGQGVDGLDILSLNPQFLDRYIKNDMKAALEVNRIELSRDWRELKSEQGIEMLRKIEGFNLEGKQSIAAEPVDPTYVITIDNLLKMLSIQLRMKNGLPVMIMVCLCTRGCVV